MQDESGGFVAAWASLSQSRRLSAGSARSAGVGEVVRRGGRSLPGWRKG